MVIDIVPILGCPVVLATGQKVAVIDRVVFDGKDAKIAGFQVNLTGVLKRSAGLEMSQVISLERNLVTIDNDKVLNRDLKGFDDLTRHWGKVLGVKARTESNRQIGRVTDLTVDDQTGHITRLYLRDFLRERIIPRQYLIGITPKEIIFKDIVDQPIFNQTATLETTAG
ncbi:MAG: PRC-barrel domain-containing protein [Patescibacteria group bacterium]